MKDVLIYIKGVQGLDGDTDTIELTTAGKYGLKNGSHYISYDDSEMLGVKNVKTVVHVKSDNTVVLQRSGGMQSRLVIKHGERNSCHYSTVQGNLVLGIFGESVENRLLDSEKTLKMTYTIDSNSRLISRNVVEISIKEVN